MVGDVDVDGGVAQADEGDTTIGGATSSSSGGGGGELDDEPGPEPGGELDGSELDDDENDEEADEIDDIGEAEPTTASPPALLRTSAGGERLGGCDCTADRASSDGLARYAVMAAEVLLLVTRHEVDLAQPGTAAGAVPSRARCC